ncbi:GDNF family receptor alpha 3 precursor [Triplophysa rosa]|uniref:GDNF family receptor alpha 3 n=1 Tax=Triplophysa rosa TaxID=992332 RepID=A0A9W7TS66_TRIRA|nr:GDNF family receptor alpha 3 precursor [Triplophysa rosa]
MVSVLRASRYASQRVTHRFSGTVLPRDTWRKLSVSILISMVGQLVHSSPDERDEVAECEEDDEEEEEDENETGAGGFNVIPPFSEKVTVTNLGSEAGRVHSRAATLSELHFLFAVLLLIALSWG